MLSERWTGARVLKRWMQRSLFYRNVISIINWSWYQTKIGKKSAFSCSLTRSSRRILPILASFLTFFRVFSTCFTTLISCFLWSLCLFLSGLFSLKTLSPRTWIMTISSGWQSSSSAGIIAFRVDPKLQNTENYCSTTTSPVRFPTQNAFCNLIAYAASHLPAHVKPSSNA